MTINGFFRELLLFEIVIGALTIKTILNGNLSFLQQLSLLCSYSFRKVYRSLFFCTSPRVYVNTL